MTKAEIKVGLLGLVAIGTAAITGMKDRVKHLETHVVQRVGIDPQIGAIEDLVNQAQALADGIAVEVDPAKVEVASAESGEPLTATAGEPGEAIPTVALPASDGSRVAGVSSDPVDPAIDPNGDPGEAPAKKTGTTSRTR